MQYSSMASVLENISDAFLSLDHEWRITYVNSEAQKLLGRTSEELIGRHICAALGRKNTCPFFTKYQEAVATGRTVVFEAFDTLCNVWAKVRAVPCPDGLMIFCRDISDKKCLYRLNETLNNIRKLSIQATDIDEFIQGVITQVAKGMKCNAAIGCTNQRNVWQANYVYNLAPSFIGKPVSEKLLAHLMEAVFRRQPVEFSISELSERQMVFDNSYGFDPGATVAVPLFVKENPLGCIIFHTSAANFSKGQLEFAKRACEYIQPLLTNVSLELRDKKYLATFKAILDQVPIGIALFDTRLRYTQVNTWIASRLGSTSEKIIGRTIRDVFTEAFGKDIAEQRVAICRKALETGETFSISAWRPPGTDVDMDWNLKRIEVDGVAVGLLQTAIDVSNYIHMQNQLENYQQRLEQLVEERTGELSRANDRFFTAFYASPSIMSIFDSNGKAVDVNNSFVKTSGWSRAEMIGYTILERGICDEKLGFALWREFWQVGYIHNREISFYTKDGQTRISLLSAEKIILDGQPHMLALTTDVTEIKLMEKEMLRLDRMNLVGQMAAGISHEVRNPMTTIRGFLQMLQKKPECQQYRDYFGLMISELDRANSIISEFLSVAKTKQSSTSEADLNDIIKAMEPLLTTDAIATGKTITLNLGQINRLKLNEKEIRQLLLNLVRNGLEAMPKGGTVTIRTYQKKGQVVLAVQDEGTGIPQHIMGKLGTPFLTSKENGTGLGLAICYGIAERHNAKLTVSTSSEGTTFFLCFQE